MWSVTSDFGDYQDEWRFATQQAAKKFYLESFANWPKMDGKSALSVVLQDPSGNTISIERSRVD